MTINREHLKQGVLMVTDSVIIALMGHVPHSGIPIVYTGLRPGEKMHEELFLGDIERATRFKDINIGKVQCVEESNLNKSLAELFRLAETDSDAARLRAAIKRIVPEYIESFSSTGN